MLICPDSSVLIPTLLEYHSQHSLARQALQRHIDHGDQLGFAAHSLAETYSTMTRLPKELRAKPDEVMNSIEESFLSRGAVVALTAEEYLSLLRAAPARSVFGGRLYDALIAATAVKAGADAILTLNRRHFEELEPSLKVLVPGESE